MKLHKYIYLKPPISWKMHHVQDKGGPPLALALPENWSCSFSRSPQWDHYVDNVSSLCLLCIHSESGSLQADDACFCHGLLWVMDKEVPKTLKTATCDLWKTYSGGSHKTCPNTGKHLHRIYLYGKKIRFV